MQRVAILQSYLELKAEVVIAHDMLHRTPPGLKGPSQSAVTAHHPSRRSQCPILMLEFRSGSIIPILSGQYERRPTTCSDQYSF